MIWGWKVGLGAAKPKGGEFDPPRIPSRKGFHAPCTGVQVQSTLRLRRYTPLFERVVLISCGVRDVLDRKKEKQAPARRETLLGRSKPLYGRTDEEENRAGAASRCQAKDTQHRDLPQSRRQVDSMTRWGPRPEQDFNKTVANLQGAGINRR